jgi:hypothetical protein
MQYVEVHRSLSSPYAAIQIRAQTVAALPVPYRQELFRLLQQYAIPPASNNRGIGGFDPNGLPITGLIAGQYADQFRAQLELLIHRGLGGG